MTHVDQTSHRKVDLTLSEALYGSNPGPNMNSRSLKRHGQCIYSIYSIYVHAYILLTRGAQEGKIVSSCAQLKRFLVTVLGHNPSAHGNTLPSKHHTPHTSNPIILRLGTTTGARATTMGGKTSSCCAGSERTRCCRAAAASIGSSAVPRR